jgi:uncharacterized protein (TIRG00374 family)
VTFEQVSIKTEKMSSKFKSLLIKILKITVPLFLGIIILYFLYKGTDFKDLWSKIKTANWAILSFSLLFGLSGNLIRGLRWNLIIKPLGYNPKKSNLVYAVLGNYAVNFALPRIGEIWRCTVISKEEKIPFTKLIGTLLIDRIFDMFMVILIIVLAVFLNVKEFHRNIQNFNIPPILTSSSFYIGLLIGLLLLIAVLLLFKENKIVKKVRLFIATLWSDILSIKNMKTKNRFFIYSFGIWISYFLYFFVTFFAFDFTYHLGISAALFIFTLNSISMGIPSNGGLGPWQAATVFGLCAFMVTREDATVFATAVFGFQSVWVVACGLFGIAMLSLKNRKKQPL